MNTPKIIRTSMSRPPRLCVYGPHGIGKSTFGSNCPKPIFIPTEDGLEGLSVDSFNLSTNLDEFLTKLKFLSTSKHEYRTAVIDSADWLQSLVFDRVCEMTGVTDIGALEFGRGYQMAGHIWGTILDSLRELNESKRMMIVLLAHAQIRKFEDPERENYDRYHLDLQKTAAAMVAEWVDVLGFANYRIATVEKKEKFGAKSIKAKSTGERMLYLSERPAFTAKNRYGLPDAVPLSWDSFSEHFKARKEASAGGATKKEGNLHKTAEEKKVRDLDKGSKIEAGAPTPPNVNGEGAELDVSVSPKDLGERMAEIRAKLSQPIED